MVDLNKKEKKNNSKAVKLQGIANITYDEAKYALKKNDDDLLEALWFLQKKGRVRNSKVYYYNTRDYHPSSNNIHNDNINNNNKKKTYSAQKISQEVNGIFRKGSKNYFEIYRMDMEPIKVPLAVFIILLFTAFGIIVPLIIVGMFFNTTYRFTGENINENDNINSFLNKCTDKIQSYIKKRRGHKK